VICAQYIDSNGVAVLSPIVPQPADLSQCAAVVLTGEEMGVVSLTSFPALADVATAYAGGLTLVVGPWLVARACGAVVNIIK
jgi:hypothetical protein